MRIKTNVKIIVAILFSVLLQGCVTMSKDECLQADWYIKGLADASEGYGLERMDNHARACARVAVTPNRKDYEAGHKKGARLYCSVSKGYSEGRRGASYNGICPQDLERDFLRAYRDGQDLFFIQQKINQLGGDIAYAHNRIESNYSEIHRLKHHIVDRDSSPQERRNLLRRIDELQFEITDLEIHLDRNIREVEWSKNDYRSLEDKHYRMGYNFAADRHL